MLIISINSVPAAVVWGGVNDAGVDDGVLNRFRAAKNRGIYRVAFAAHAAPSYRYTCSAKIPTRIVYPPPLPVGGHIPKRRSLQQK